MHLAEETAFFWLVLSACCTYSFLGQTKLGLWNPLEGGAPWCSHQGLRGGVKVGHKGPQETGKTFSAPPFTTPMSTRMEKSLSYSSSQDSTSLPQPPTEANPASEARAGRGRVGGGLAGSGAYLPLQEEQVAAVLPGAPGFLCTLRLASFSRQSSLGRPGPMAQTPDDISCELRGKPCLALPGSPPGGEQVV